MKILVIGGTGNVGSRVIAELTARKATVRALVRKKDSAKLPTGVESVEGDLLNPVSIGNALKGVDALYLLNAVQPDELTQGLIAFDLARKHKLRHIAYHSVLHAGNFKDVPHFAAKAAIEDALRQFDLPFTILAPGYFFQNDLQLKDPLMKNSLYPMPLGAKGIAVVDIRDIAEAAAISLTTPGHEGKTYNLASSELLSGPSAAAIWSESLGKSIQYPAENFDQFEEQLRSQAPPWSAFDIRMMFQGYVERGFAPEPGDVQTLTQLLSHPPRSYRDFARETAAQWQGGS